MTTFWIVTGVVVTVLLVGAWLYDRKWSVNHKNLPSEAHRAGAEADAWRTQHGTTFGDTF
jgi:hypothetical protein